MTDDAPAASATNVVWHAGASSREARWAALGQRGATVWLTGLPARASRRSPSALEETLVDAGRFAYVLDGDNLRHGLNGDLGFSDEDRDRERPPHRRTSRGCWPTPAPSRSSRSSRRFRPRATPRARCTRPSGLAFVEVFVDTPLEECERRDPKGLYAKARAGEIAAASPGSTAPYEAPDSPDLRLVRPRSPDGRGARTRRTGPRANASRRVAPDEHRAATGAARHRPTPASSRTYPPTVPRGSSNRVSRRATRAA